LRPNANKCESIVISIEVNIIACRSQRASVAVFRVREVTIKVKRCIWRIVANANATAAEQRSVIACATAGCNG
jgi:hypothetical protein